MNLWKEKYGSEQNQLSSYNLIELAVFYLFCIPDDASYCESLHKLREQENNKLHTFKVILHVV